jgi:hypothetical protein
MKKLIYIFLIVISGCASQQGTVPYDDIRNVTANCNTAKSQIDYLITQIKRYQDYHLGQPLSDEDRKYIGKAKNIIWSLRSTCSENYI